MNHRLEAILSWSGRPDSRSGSREVQAQIRIHRFLCLLGLVLIPTFGILYETSNPEAVDPWGARIGVTALFGALLIGSYLSEQIRRYFSVWMQGVLYVVMGWVEWLAVANGFSAEYAMGLLLVYALVPLVVGLQARSIVPILAILGFGFLLTAVGLLAVPTPRTNPWILIAAMGAVALAEASIIHGRLSIRAQLHAAKEEAERADRMKSALLANMSHEIRTPLTSIIGFAEAITAKASDRDGSSYEEFGQCAGLIKKSGNRLLRTFNAVVHLAELEGGEMHLDPQPIDLTALADEVVDEFQQSAENARVSLQTVSRDRSLLGRADERGLRIVLRHLVSNAIKYTPKGGDVSVRTRADESGPVIVVEDTGIGMSPSRVDNLFDPFRQESEGNTREYRGSGLGLTITKRLVDELQGSIHVETQKGAGSRFLVRIPPSNGVH